jgi:pyruvate/2-oxoglutarate dehydrogenase complex dihydrolipoamide dehydrogenase (E3) component
VPELDGLDLDKAGIRRSASDPARLALTASFRTTNRRVHAIGDCATGPRSVEAARRAASIVVRAALLGLPQIGRPSPQLRAVHTDPGIAEVGLGEAGARRRLGNRFRIERIGFGENDLSRARHETHGLVKLIAAPGGRLLGAGVVGPGAGELAALFAVAIAAGLDARRLAAVDFPWPTRAAMAGRIGETLARAEGPGPVLRRWQALVRLLP